MRVSLIIENDRTQIVLHPENDIDEATLKLFPDNGFIQFSTRRGTFYPCQGGWSRWGDSASENKSVILVQVDE